MSDQDRPIQNPDKRFGVWNITQIYHKETNKSGIVPNVNDAVLDWTRGWLRVTDVYVDGSSRLDPAEFPTTEELSSQAKRYGTGPGDATSSARAYLDTSVFPYRLLVDAAVVLYGSEKKEVKIFRGTDIGNPTNVISARYDATNTYISDTIPLKVVATDDVNNLAIKSVAEGYCTAELKDGELVTMVVYNNSNSISKIKELLIKNTSYVVPAEAPVNRVTQIELLSPFMSPTNPTELEVPVNVPMSSVAVMARIHYADRVVEKSIDGAKVILHGGDEYISTVTSAPGKLVLTYNLSPNEVSVDTSNGSSKHISRPYSIRTVTTVGSYSVKLFVVPTWVDEYTGYQLEYYLYDLDRSDFFNVTSLIEAGINSQPFDGLKYNTVQRITVAIELDRVDPRLKSYRHVQQFGVSLMDDGLSVNTGWLIQYDLSKANEYGRNLALTATMMSVGNWNLDISNGYSKFETWLDDIYYDSLPLYDTQTETRAPVPTHFVLEINGMRTEYEIARWNSVLRSITGGSRGKAVVLHWKRKIGGTVLNLGCSPLRIKHTLR